jgi:hypothetical protein
MMGAFIVGIYSVAFIIAIGIFMVLVKEDKDKK